MRLQKYLTERWVKSFKDKSPIAGRETFVEVFENPSAKEFRDAANSTTWDKIRGNFVRFYVDMKKKRVYIWHPEAVHADAWRQFGDGRPPADSTLLGGAAKKVSGKWKMVDSDMGVKRNLLDYDIEDWEWANKWINVTDYLEDFKIKFNL
jgi:hypothetical protein